MGKFLEQAKHNESFHEVTCRHCPETFFDWKITTLFYASIHYVKALANQTGADIGNNHAEIRNNIKPQMPGIRIHTMPMGKGAYGLYDYLYSASHRSRYGGVVDLSQKFTDEDTFNAIMKSDHEKCVEAYAKLKDYIINKRGLKVE